MGKIYRRNGVWYGTADDMIARIAALEARVAAADKLIQDLIKHEGAEGFSKSTGDLLADYEVTKEQSE